MQIDLATVKVLLNNCAAIIIDMDVLVYPGNNTEPGIFLFAKWENEGLEYELEFHEDDNQTVECEQHILHLIESKDKESITVQLLTCMDLHETIAKMG
jgi:hypothetical protein